MIKDNGLHELSRSLIAFYNNKLKKKQKKNPTYFYHT